MSGLKVRALLTEHYPHVFGHHTFLYVRKHSNMLSELTMLFSPIELKLFFWASSDLLSNEMTNN